MTTERSTSATAARLVGGPGPARRRWLLRHHADREPRPTVRRAAPARRLHRHRAQTVPVTVPLTCHEAPRTGSVLVNGTLNVCPQIDGISASPDRGAGRRLGRPHRHRARRRRRPVAAHVSLERDLRALHRARRARPRASPARRRAPRRSRSPSRTATPPPSCADTSTVTVTCTRAPAASTCPLGNGAGAIKHVIYLQFDNTHLTRDRANVPSDLEQMPHLLNFIRGNGTMMANDHTDADLAHRGRHPVVADRRLPGPPRPDASATATCAPARPAPSRSRARSATGPTTAAAHTSPTWSAPTAPTSPAPWVAYTRAGCDVGAVAHRQHRPREHRHSAPSAT